MTALGLIAFCTAFLGANLAGLTAESATIAIATTIIVGALAFAQELLLQNPDGLTALLSPPAAVTAIKAPSYTITQNSKGNFVVQSPTLTGEFEYLSDAQAAVKSAGLS
jgi:hypothetical protein